MPSAADILVSAAKFALTQSLNQVTSQNPCGDEMMMTSATTDEDVGGYLVEQAAP